MDAGGGAGAASVAAGSRGMLAVRLQHMILSG